jgi:hypothetical protein
VENAVSLTLNEAGYVVEQSNTAINRAVDRGVIKAKLQRRGKVRLRKVGPTELRFLAISGEVERKLTPAGRREVYEAMRRLSTDAHRLEIGVMTFRSLARSPQSGLACSAPRKRTNATARWRQRRG